MSYLIAMLLGALQGVAEFLPISSSGHLVIAETLLGSGFESLELNVALHVGTLGSILVIYRRDLLPILWQPRLCLAIVVATLPVVVVGLTLKEFFEQAFSTPLVVGCAWLVTALLMALTRQVDRDETSIENITLRQALVVGLFQSVALVPGISRSGSTIFAALLMGMQRDAAAKFSFLIAIPAICGAAILETKDVIEQGGLQSEVGPLLLGMIVAFLVGIAALRGLLAVVSRRGLHWFAVYCVCAGVATIVWQLLSR